MIRANIDPSMIHNPGSSGCFMLQFPKYRVCCVDVKKKKKLTETEKNWHGKFATLGYWL